MDWDKTLHSEAQKPRFDLQIPRLLCFLKIFRFLVNFKFFKIRILLKYVLVYTIRVFLVYTIRVFFMGTSRFLGTHEMVTGEWKNLIITGGSCGKKLGSFFRGWSYGCSHGYG